MDGQQQQDDGLTRRDLVRIGSAGALTLTGASFLAACGGGGKTTAATGAAGSSGPAFSSGPASGGTPVRGGALRIGMPTGGESETIDVRHLATNPDVCRAPQLYDPLVFSTNDSGVEAALATAWESNRDATLWTFTLRDGVVFHDGKPLTADDLVYTIKASWGSKENSIYGIMKQLVDFKGVRKRDKLTVEVPMLQGFAQFPTLLTGGRTLVVQDGTKDWNAGVGTGPFTLDSFRPGSRSEFKANPNYWIEGRPYVDSLTIDSSFSDPTAAFNALLAGNVDIVPGVPPALARANAASKSIVLANQPGPGFIAEVMHVNKAPFNDPRVVQAMKLVADRQASVTNVFDGYATLGNDLMGYTDKYHVTAKAEEDVARAKSLLKAAGQEDLRVTLTTAGIYPGVNEHATFFANAASKAGIKIKLRQTSPSTFFVAPWPDRLFQMTQWSASTNSLANFYLLALNKDAAFNETGWYRPAADKLLFDALAEVDADKAEQKWAAVQELQRKEGGYIINSNLNFVDGYSPKVRGVSTNRVSNCNNYTFSGGWLAA